MNINLESHQAVKNMADESTRRVSKFKRYASQCYAAFAAEFVKIIIGLLSGFTSVLIAELHKPDAEIEMSVDDLGWFSSRFFITPVGSLLAGLIAHKIGNRSTILLASILYTVCCLIFYFATDAAMLLVAQALSGLAVPFSAGPCIIYIVEIAQPNIRSALTATTTLSTVVAAFLIVLLSNFFHWRILILIILVFPIVGFLAVCTIPESPYWLARKGKLVEAIEALCWVRGWTTPSNVVSEFEKMKETYECSSSNLENERKIRWHSKALSYVADTFKPFSQKTFYVPLASMCAMYIIHDLAGSHILATYLIVIFREMKSPLEPNLAATIFDAASVLGGLIYILSVNRTGKKKLAYVSLVVAAISYFVSSAALLLTEYGFSSDVCLWIATISMILSTFSTSAGIDKVMVMLSAEIYPSKLRNVGSGIGLFIFAVSGALSNKLFLYALDILTLPGIFIMFGSATIISLFIFYSIFPETEGKTLKEIEEHYSGVKKLNDRDAFHGI